MVDRLEEKAHFQSRIDLVRSRRECRIETKVGEHIVVTQGSRDDGEICGTLIYKRSLVNGHFLVYCDTSYGIDEALSHHIDMVESVAHNPDYFSLNNKIFRGEYVKRLEETNGK